MYRVQRIDIATLKQRLQADHPQTSTMTTVSGDYSVSYASRASFPSALEHYLNEHVPTTWRLISCSVDKDTVTCVWSVAE